MFSQYADLILLVVIIIVTLAIVLIILLLRKVNNLEKINEVLRKKERKFVTENIGWRNTIPKAIRLGEANAENIKSLAGQQDNLNRFLGEVLNISNLIPSKELGIETSDIIEELRERVRWAEELEKYQAEDNDFYKGD